MITKHFMIARVDRGRAFLFVKDGESGNSKFKVQSKVQNSLSLLTLNLKLAVMIIVNLSGNPLRDEVSNAGDCGGD
jgi:hypothetical protein